MRRMWSRLRAMLRRLVCHVEEAAIGGACQPKLREGPSVRRRYGGQPSLGSGAKAGEPPRNRTENPQIKSLLLCQLS